MQKLLKLHLQTINRFLITQIFMDTSLPPYSISPSGIACLLSTPPIPLLSLALKSIKINQILLCKDTIQCFRLTLELTETVECSCIDPPLIKIATSAAIPKLSKK